MDLGLTGRVAAVTGSGRGIGAATARFLAEEGARVVVIDQHADSAEETAASIRAQGGDAFAVSCDVTDKAAVDAAAAAALQHYGRIDVLVNNAGLTKDRTLLKMDEADWDLVIDVTLKGAFHWCRAVLPAMRENKWGRVINISSRSVFGNPGQTNYAAAKLGLVGFTRSLSLETARNGITVNAIAPGFIETEGMNSIPNHAQLKEAATAKTPVGFLGAPQDIASMVAYLASEHARYISGTTVFVTGGRFSS